MWNWIAAVLSPSLETCRGVLFRYQVMLGLGKPFFTSQVAIWEKKKKGRERREDEFFQLSKNFPQHQWKLPHLWLVVRNDDLGVYSFNCGETRYGWEKGKKRFKHWETQRFQPTGDLLRRTPFNTLLFFSLVQKDSRWSVIQASAEKNGLKTL